VLLLRPSANHTTRTIDILHVQVFWGFSTGSFLLRWTCCPGETAATWWRWRARWRSHSNPRIL